MTDLFGRALLDYYRGQQDRPSHQCDGDEKCVHSVEEFYFGRFDSQASADWPHDAYYYRAALRNANQ